MYITFRGRQNVNVYPWAGNWMYLMQRVTGLIAFAYIIQHVWRQRFAGIQLPEHPGAAFHKVQVELSNPWMLAVYAIAMIATCWHFSYGIWLFAAKWGITPGDKARRNSGYVCTALGVVLVTIGLSQPLRLRRAQLQKCTSGFNSRTNRDGNNGTRPNIRRSTCVTIEMADSNQRGCPILRGSIA